jgi:uncharacterized protein (DUF927 family)
MLLKTFESSSTGRELILTLLRIGTIEELTRAIHETTTAIRDTATEITDTVKHLKESGILLDTAKAVRDSSSRRNNTGS